MQYLLINTKDTLSDISKIVGQKNIDLVLHENSLPRTPRIGEAWADKCDTLIANTPNEVTAARKSALLNGLTHSEEVFEKACLMNEDEWKVFSAFQAFPDALRVPESIELPYSTKVIGAKLSDVTAASIGDAAISVSSARGTATSTSSSQASSGTASGNVPRNSTQANSTKLVSVLSIARASKKSTSSSTSRSSTPSTADSVSPVAYRAVMRDLKTSSTIDPSVFESVNTSPPYTLNNSAKIDVKTTQQAFHLPWGKIQLYSTLLHETMDFPAYPEHIDTSRSASYTSMPDIIYAYEPWIVYQNSGPREQSLEFHLHRDMWSGDHRDGMANSLIRFCEANTFPDYKGSAVLAPVVRLYIDGSLFISGLLTATVVNWSGPLGLDNWYLEFTLSLSIQEVSEFALNVNSVRNLGLKGN